MSWFQRSSKRGQVSSTMSEDIFLDDGWEFTSASNVVSTLVLVGRTGNGKSATGNSIIGRKGFLSQLSLSGVTETCEMQSTLLKDGRTVNVIDTPGLFDSSISSEYISKEISRCVDLAKDGIHAVLVVFSVRNRFSKEEEAVIQNLEMLFGERIFDYMIVVFTGGDDLEDDGLTLEEYIGHRCPESFQKFLQVCKHRVVLVDNKTKDDNKRAKQLHELLTFVDKVVEESDGQPFSDQLFVKNKVEQEAKQIIDSLIEQLNVEKTARLKSEKTATEIQAESNEEISKLKEEFERAQKQFDKTALEIQEESNEVISKLKEDLERAQKQSDMDALERAQKQSDKTALVIQEESNEVISKLKDDLERAGEQSDMDASEIHVKLNEVITKFKEDLKRARAQSDKTTSDIQVKLNEVMSKLKEDLKRIQEQSIRMALELHGRVGNNQCAIL